MERPRHLRRRRPRARPRRPRAAYGRTAGHGGRALLDIGVGERPPGRAQEVAVFLGRRRRWDVHDRIVAVWRDGDAAIRNRPSGSLPALTAPMPWRSCLRNMVTPRSVAPRCSRAWTATGRCVTCASKSPGRRWLASWESPSGSCPGSMTPRSAHHRRGALGLAHVPELDEHRVGVVLGHDPPAHHRPAERMDRDARPPVGRDLLEIGQDVLHHAAQTLSPTRRVAM